MGIGSQRSSYLALALALALALSASLLVGCAAPSPTPDGGGVVDEEAADRLWSVVIAQYPGATRPDAELVRFTHPDEWASTISGCLHELGFIDASVRPDGGVEMTNAESQGEPYAVAFYTCSVRYQVDPKFQARWNEEKLREIWNYWDASLLPCLKTEGYGGIELPSETTFVETYYDSGWTPYVDLLAAVSDEEEYFRLFELCPEWPPDLYG